MIFSWGVRQTPSNTKFSFVCANSIRDVGSDSDTDQVYFYDSTTDVYKLISLDTLTWDANSLFMSADAGTIIYYTRTDAGDSILEYDLATESTSTITSNPYGLTLWDADSSLNTLAYMSNSFEGGFTHQQLVVNKNDTEEVVEDFTQDIEGSMQFIDARLSRDGTKLIYITGNLYDSQRSALRSLYMYNISTGEKTTLEENFSTMSNHYEWDMNSDVSTLVFSMNAPWGTEDLESQTYIYTFDVASKTHKEIYKEYVEGVHVSPDASSIYTFSKTTSKLVQLSNP